MLTRSRLTRAWLMRGLVTLAGAGLLLAGCAAAGSGSPAGTTAPSSPMSSMSVWATLSDRPGSSTVPAGSGVPDWPAIQSAVAEADSQLGRAKSEGWWTGPVCSPDIEMHRDNAGQDPLSDEQVRAECAANLAEFQASRDDYAALQALDPAARTAELARVGALLGLPAGQEPTVGQIVVAHGCEQGWISDPADCAG